MESRTVVLRAVDATAAASHYFSMSTLAEIEQAAESLALEQKHALLLFLGAQLRVAPGSRTPRSLPPAERAADLRRWAASHERGPGLPEMAVGRDAIYD